MELLSIRFFLLHLVELFSIWTALFWMNEQDPKQPLARWKIVMCVSIQYILSLAVNLFIKNTGLSIFELVSVPLMLISLLLCCILFTGGVVKIFLSILISDLWGGMVEITMSLLYCVISGRKLEIIYIYELKDDILLQFLYEILFWSMMLGLCKPLFLKFRKLSILEGKLFSFLFIGYFSLGAFLRVTPVASFEGTIKQYPDTLLFIACYSSIFIFFLGYNRKNLMQLEIQSLYLKQKLQQEYNLVFQDMERNIRCFRHDIKKHMDALDYLENNSTVEIPQEQLKQYRSSLNSIYRELTYGNYCNAMDINTILMQLDKQIQNTSASFSVSLRNLKIDSLPVYLRMQLFEKGSNWIQEQIVQEQITQERITQKHITQEHIIQEHMPLKQIPERNTLKIIDSPVQNISIKGMTHAGYHTVKFTVTVQKLNTSDKASAKNIPGLQKWILQKKINFQHTREIQKLLHKYGGTCQMEKRSISPNDMKNTVMKTEKAILKITLTAAWHGKQG